jgi:uncharacterized protein HemX
VRLAAAVVVVALTLAGPIARAQEPPSTPTTLVEVPSRDIIPKPGSGASPDDAGDRGGALQITVLVLVVLAIGAAVVLVVRQSRRARSGG